MNRRNFIQSQTFLGSDVSSSDERSSIVLSDSFVTTVCIHIFGP